MGAQMITAFADPFDALLNLQRELEARMTSDWLQDRTTSRGPFPPINVFQQGDEHTGNNRTAWHRQKRPANPGQG